MSAEQPTGAGVPHAVLRARCREIGLPSWRCDTGGEIIEEPDEPGLAGVWLRSGPVVQWVTRAARRGGGAGRIVVEPLFDGCWLIVVNERIRRRRVGTTIAMAMGEAMADSAEFAGACRDAQLSPGAVAAALKPLSRFSASSVGAVATSLGWAAGDLAAVDDNERAVGGFTDELSSCYEAISVLYTLGRSMSGLGAPSGFIELTCDRLMETMPFGWLVLRLADEFRTLAPGGQVLHVRGSVPTDEATIGRVAAALLVRARESRVSPIMTDAEPEARGLGPQVLVQPIPTDRGVAGVMLMGGKHGPDPQLSSYDLHLVEAACGFLGAFLHNASLYADQQAMFVGSLRALTASIDAKDRYTRGHSERVAQVARALTIAAGLGEALADRVHLCGLLHDVGKIGVPESVLCKPGRLTEAEFDAIKLHPEIGHRILCDIPQLRDILPGVLSHHERWDGGGYPQGLAGEQIPLMARLIGLADTFDAMSSTRSYRGAMRRSKVMAEISSCAGSQFDPDLARVFLTLDLNEYDRLVSRHEREHGLAA